jgi:AmmeMemoRadiSam system protein B
VNETLPPYVAGRFYPGDPEDLLRRVRALLAAARGSGPAPRAIVAPHAGYDYSGPVAASAYARVAALRGTVRRVLLIGPAHFVRMDCMAAPAYSAFATPLGEVALDRETIGQLLRQPWVRELSAAFRGEHSLEVHLPFLQVTLGEFLLTPLLAGSAKEEHIARIIGEFWRDPDTLVVVSTDLSHYLPVGVARQTDAATCRAIEALQPDDIGEDQACGDRPLKGLLAAARDRGLRVETLDLRNSGDTAGMHDAVVGYGAWALVDDSEAVAPRR